MQCSEAKLVKSKKNKNELEWQVTTRMIPNNILIKNMMALKELEETNKALRGVLELERKTNNALTSINNRLREQLEAVNKNATE